MVKASKGLRSKTRQIFRKKLEDRRKSPIAKSLQTFAQGEKASIVIDSSVHKGMPHPRFHGLTGTVIGMQGRAYLVSVKAGDKNKIIISAPEHMRKLK